MKVTAVIDGIEVRVERDTTILEAARLAGISIPTLCHHEALEPYGACRLCTVEVETRPGKTKLVTACNFPLRRDTVVSTRSDRVLRGRRMIVELLLARCPGVPILEKLAAELGVPSPRFEQGKGDCILCGLCVRVCREVVGVSAIGFIDRGPSREVDTPFRIDSQTCIGCGACTHVCPTGRMQMEFKAVERFLESPAQGRFCRYMRMGFVSYKLCPNSYQCWKCEYDQAFEDRFPGSHPAFERR